MSRTHARAGRFFFMSRFVAVAFCGLCVGLILASLVLTTTRSVSNLAVIVSFIVSAVFVAIGVIVHRIGQHLTLANQLTIRSETTPELAASLRCVTAYMTVANTIIAAAAGLMAIGFLSRILEGFAVFG